MTFHEFQRGFSVMDGRRCVATARRWGCGLWMITLKNASWIDAISDPKRAANLKRMKLRPGMGAHLKVCKTKAQVRRELRALAAE